MKRYTVIDNKSGIKFHYSWLAWNFAWFVVFIMGIILGCVVSAPLSAQNLRLEGDHYIRNRERVDKPVVIEIYNWDYYVITAHPICDTIYYDHMQEYRISRDSSLRVVIMPICEEIDSLSFGWESNGYLKYTNGDVYVFPVLWKSKIKRRGRK